MAGGAVRILLLVYVGIDLYLSQITVFGHEWEVVNLENFGY